MKRILVWVVIVVLALVVVGYFARGFIARKSVEVGVRQITGFPLEIGSIQVGVLGSWVKVRDLRLQNPPGYEDPTFVVMPELFIDYRFGSMLRAAPHITDMLVNIEQLTLVKNAQGESNAVTLKEALASGSDSSTQYRIDQLRVHVGTVTIKDSSRAKPSERTIRLNVDATYQNITDSTDISRLVLLTVMGQVKLPDIGIKADDLKKGLRNVTDAAGQTVGGAVDAIGDAGKSVFDALKQVVPEK